MCLQRYLVAVGGMALQQLRREQLDQALSAEDTVLLQQKGVLEPAIPQPSGIRREAGAVVRVGEKERLSYLIHSGTSVNKSQLYLLRVTDSLIIKKIEKSYKFAH